MSDIAVDRTLEAANRKAKQIPVPTGYHILCMVPKIEDTYGDSRIAKADRTVDIEQQTTMVLFVMELGPDAYKDKTKFPNGAWCAKGDFIITRSYAGTRIKIHGSEFRIINDDSVDATVEDPRGVGRA